MIRVDRLFVGIVSIVNGFIGSISIAVFIKYHIYPISSIFIVQASPPMIT